MSHTQPKKKLALAIISLLPFVFLARAAHTFMTGSYWSAPRNSPPVEYTGPAAYMFAGTNIALALIIAIWIFFELGFLIKTKQQAILLSFIIFAVCAACFCLGLSY